MASENQHITEQLQHLADGFLSFDAEGFYIPSHAKVTLSNEQAAQLGLDELEGTEGSGFWIDADRLVRAVRPERIKDRSTSPVDPASTPVTDPPSATEPDFNKVRPNPKK